VKIRIGVTAALLTMLAACGSNEQAARKAHDEHAAAYQTGRAAHEVARKGGRIAEKVARKLAEEAKAAGQGWRQQSRADRARNKDQN
jgi:hypothetical protein